MTHIRYYTLKDRSSVARLNADYYTREHGFDASFLIAMTAALDRIEPFIQAQTGVGWVVSNSTEIAGSLFLTPDGPGEGRIGLFFLRPELHGRGLGDELLGRCFETAASLCFSVLRVSTFTIHGAACGLYRRFGMTQERQTDCRVFGHDLVRVDFVKDCTAAV